MATDPQLEHYLERLDKSLGKISVTERAEIITEMKSHILETQDREPNRILTDILAALGEPETVANRYLMEKGIQPGKAPKTPMIKWLTIGFLGTFGLITAFLLIGVWMLTPLIKVDGDRVKILGGMIDVTDTSMASAGKKRTKNSLSFSLGGESETFDGAETLKHGEFSQVQIPFLNGQLEIASSPNDNLTWNCGIKGDRKKAQLKKVGKNFVIDLKELQGIDCKVLVPNFISVKAKGVNGEIELKQPQFQTEASLENGQISIKPDPTKKYRYETKVTLGSSAEFETSADPQAILVRATVGNGIIEND